MSAEQQSRPEQTLSRVPSNYHNNAGGFNFADGHSEIHKWKDGRTVPPHQKDVHLFINTGGVYSQNNIDVLWLQTHATGKKQRPINCLGRSARRSRVITLRDTLQFTAVLC